ncbi:MAG: 50S ribosomal protein L21 [Nitriliruptorales bacterium]
MYAVIATGGKQYRVEPGEELRIEKLDGAVGDSVELRPVLIVDDDGNVATGGDLEDRTVDATITGHGRGDKIRVFTYKNKSRQRRRKGHRQSYTRIKVGDLAGGKAAKKAAEQPAETATEAPDTGAETTESPEA